jgi:hypothetical protein
VSIIPTRHPFFFVYLPLSPFNGSSHRRHSPASKRTYYLKDREHRKAASNVGTWLML